MTTPRDRLPALHNLPHQVTELTSSASSRPGLPSRDVAQPIKHPLQILLLRGSHCPLRIFTASHYRPVSVQHRSPRTNTFAGSVTHACSFSAIARRAFRCRSLANQSLQWLHPPPADALQCAALSSPIVFRSLAAACSSEQPCRRSEI